MSENKIEAILNNSASFGKLNVILHAKAPQIYFEVICKDIVSLFEPHEIIYSLFDLDSMEMKDIEVSQLGIQHNNSIIKVILIGENEEMILEYYKGHIIVEHLFYPDNIPPLRGYSLIKKYQQEKPDSNLVVGYELSININSYDLSLTDIASDESLHPVFVVKKGGEGNCLIEEYVSDNSKVSEQKVEIIKEYLKLIDISS